MLDSRFLEEFSLISSFRSDGDVISRPLLQSLVALLHTFSPQSHSSIFVTPFLASSRTYYKAEGVRLVQELESSDYLRRVNRRLEEEGERCDLVLGIALKGSALRVVLEEMASGHVETIVEKGGLSSLLRALDTELTFARSLRKDSA
jgi:hypothetical protein